VVTQGHIAACLRARISTTVLETIHQIQGRGMVREIDAQTRRESDPQEPETVSTRHSARPGRAVDDQERRAKYISLAPDREATTLTPAAGSHTFLKNLHLNEETSTAQNRLFSLLARSMRWLWVGLALGALILACVHALR